MYVDQAGLSLLGAGLTGMQGRWCSADYSFRKAVWSALRIVRRSPWFLCSAVFQIQSWYRMAAARKSYLSRLQYFEDHVRHMLIAFLWG